MSLVFKSKQAIKRALSFLKLGSFFNRIGIIKKVNVVMMDGGLASQMRQFALGYALEKKTGLPTHYEIDFFRKNGKDLTGNANRQFLLLETFPKIKELYGHRFDYNRFSAICLFCNKIIKRSYFDFSTEIFDDKPKYLSQYYDNPKYFSDFRDDLIKLFQFNNNIREAASLLQNDIISDKHACAIHIRRGDFVGSVHDVCTPEYYIQAITEMLHIDNETHFYIFSNDKEYCKKIFFNINNTSFTYVETSSEIDPSIEFYLLMQFSRYIISNSGFSWMPAFLSSSKPNVKVICPKLWLKGELSKASEDVYTMPGWVSLPV